MKTVEELSKFLAQHVLESLLVPLVLGLGTQHQPLIQRSTPAFYWQSLEADHAVVATFLP